MEETPLKYCLYARKSTEGDEKQALSIDSQIKEMRQIAERENLVISEVRKESHSAKESGTRPVFNEILKDIDQGLFNAIITWAPDRLSRNAGDLGQLVDRIDQKRLITIKTFGQNFTNSPSDKFLLMILCSQAKLENDNKSINVKRGLRTRCEQELWPGKAPTGYMKPDSRERKCEVDIDPERVDIVKKIFEKVAYEKMSVRGVHAWLRYDIKFKTLNNNFLSVGNVFKILANTFYYGRFEFPKESGNWYNGSHKPIITKELFDLVQEKIKSQTLEPRSSQKEFAFTKIMTCGLCGSGITADEKFKHQKNGNVNRYVYYKCTRTRDQDCPCGFINEEDLVVQLQDLMDDLEIQTVPMKEKITAEVQRFKKFEQMLLGTKTAVTVKDIDIRNYAKFILIEGSMDEKREFLRCLKTDILLKNKKIYI